MDDENSLSPLLDQSYKTVDECNPERDNFVSESEFAECRTRVQQQISDL